MIEISAELNNYRLQGVVNFLAQGAENATATLYSGDRLAFGVTPTGDALAVIALVEPLGTIAGGSMVVTATPEVMIAISGLATWAQVKNGEGTVGWHCSVSDLAGDGQLKLPSTTLYAGGYTRIVSGTLG